MTSRSVSIIQKIAEETLKLT